MPAYQPSPHATADLYLIGGTWDLIFWNAVALAHNTPLSGDCVVFSRAFSAAQRAQIEHAARALGLNPLPYAEPEDILALVRQRASGNLFIIHLSDPFTQRICKLHPDARLVIGFEGLSGYFPSPRVRPLLEKPYSYIHYSALPVPGWVKPEHLSHAEAGPLRQSIAATRPRLGLDGQPLQIGDNAILVLGQHFHRHNVLSWEQEHDLYGEFIAAKVAEGYTVLWKEHPRNDQPFGPKYAERHPGRFRILEVDSLYSIELWGEELSRLKLIAGVCSNSLFNLRDIYGLPATSILTPRSLGEFNFNKLSKSSLINMIGIACLNHGGNLPIEMFIAAFQKSAVSDTRKSNADEESPSGFFARSLARLKRFGR